MSPWVKGDGTVQLLLGLKLGHAGRAGHSSGISHYSLKTYYITHSLAAKTKKRYVVLGDALLLLHSRTVVTALRGRYCLHQSHVQ